MQDFLATRAPVTKWGAVTPPPSLHFVPLAAAGLASVGPLLPAAGSALPSASTDAGEEHRHEARVEVVRDGGIVRGIVIVCPCGERIEVECLY